MLWVQVIAQSWMTQEALVNLLSCQKLWWSSFPSGLCAGQVVLSSWKVCCSLSAYSNNECLLSLHLKCSEVCFERGVWFGGQFCSLSRMVGTRLCTSSQSVSQSAVIILRFRAKTFEKLSSPLALCVLSQHLLFKERF